MKISIKYNLLLLLVTSLFMFSNHSADAQFFKKLKQRAKDAAEETIHQKVEQKSAEKTGEAVDEVLEAPEEAVKSKRGRKGDQEVYEDNDEYQDYDESEDAEYSEETDPGKRDFSVYTKFNFVPGENILVYDDFSVDAVGDFPSKWDTNGSGELVTFNDDDQKWLTLVNRSVYIPHGPALPEEYTVEFDLASTGLSRKTSSQAYVEVWLDSSSDYGRSRDQSFVAIPFCQYTDPGFNISKHTDGKRTIWNQIDKDVSDQVLDLTHVSIAVNKSRFRMWINETKVVDVPKLLNVGKASYVRLFPRGFNDPEEQVFVSNLKIAEGGEDLRSQLLEAGSFTTTGILFDSGSDNIKPESYGILKKIAGALSQGDLTVKIIGHTDADGSEATNLSLSEQRAMAVKNILISEFGVDGSMMQTEGKGESQPVGDNSTTEGKAQNRRVEFVKVN